MCVIILLHANIENYTHMCVCVHTLTHILSGGRGCTSRFMLWTVTVGRVGKRFVERNQKARVCVFVYVYVCV